MVSYILETERLSARDLDTRTSHQNAEQVHARD
jgi:hypothetical protein